MVTNLLFIQNLENNHVIGINKLYDVQSRWLNCKLY